MRSSSTYFVVLANSVQTLEVKAIEFHRIIVLIKAMYFSCLLDKAIHERSFSVHLMFLCVFSQYYSQAFFCIL